MRWSKCKQLLDKADERHLEADSLGRQGNEAAKRRDYPRAIKVYEMALAIHHEIGDRRAEGADLGNLGVVYYQMGNLKRAQELDRQYLNVAREVGSQVDEGNALWNLSLVLDQLGDHEQAIVHAELALKIREAIGDLNVAKVRQQLDKWRSARRS